ncbi:chemotaxis protein CheR, partial [Peptococcaceae bacterium]|nr:chemotaxis protein CheR [Peptococcaceae bacterium]
MQFSEFKNKIYQKFGLDLNSYKENQLKRRLDNLLEKRKIRDYKEFFDLLCTKREEYHNFLDYLTINVTEFFRDPRMFQILETKVVPELLSKSPNL